MSDRSAYYEEYCQRCKHGTLASESLEPYPCGEHCSFMPDINLVTALRLYGCGRRTNETGGEQDA